ncbi:Formyltransferase [Glarea lozoyensis ATCC 20868]|uniref:methionyl-tRNA formyltransferase n=1 Tax=Glarea lozoyensis (strain ATCC 20868 / MF5171) TaxID=1116229 RepID=S3D9Q8_GLAL2|nr:Formyltransferase [Glarea lozoyensis ATCC 20868]EPE34485.1 Formyltransferase [Glarea lozoyensis ATCC 20868]
MTRPRLAAYVVTFLPVSRRGLSSLCSTSTPTAKPLRILFCGSDEFSGESLRAVHAEQQRNPNLIASIDVLLRRAKLSGRGLKEKRDVPIKSIAQQLSLPIHEIDGFKGWELPKPQKESINLIIAVSFGLFIPSRLLKEAEHGGLNVHPSLLPNFRGAAPLQRLLLAGETRTGVTLQTLDHRSFDHGKILAQTQPPGIEVPHLCSYNELLQIVTPKAAEILIDGLRNRVFQPPMVDVGIYDQKQLKLAPKITSNDRRINWVEWKAITILRQSKALGRPWTMMQDRRGQQFRVTFHDVRQMDRSSPVTDQNPSSDKNILKTPIMGTQSYPAHCSLFISQENLKRELMWYTHQDSVVFVDGNGNAICIDTITVEGKTAQNARAAMLPFTLSPP